MESKTIKHIIITGGAGFIGSNLIKRFLDTINCKILCLDNLESGLLDNIKPFLEIKDKFLYLQSDIIDLGDKAGKGKPIYDSIESFLSYDGKVKIDEIYNCACVGSPPRYQIDPIHTLESNHAIKYLCELAQEYGAKLLHTSTSEIYGEPLCNPQPESYRGNVNCIGPRSCYDEGKRVAETYLYEYFKLGVKVKIVRIFNTYGPNMNPYDGRVVSNFIVQAIKNEDITVYGDGSQTRSFQYIDDLIDGFFKLMDTDDKFMGPVNIGNPNEFSIITLANLIKKKIPETKSKIVYKKLPIDDPTHRNPDISKAKEILKWEPRVNIEEGLDKTIEYFKSIKL